MKTLCPYCSFGYPDRYVPTDMLKEATDKDKPLEDRMLWTMRLAKLLGLKEYRGVKSHIGRMHPGKLNVPSAELTARETEIINGAAA